MLKSIKAVSSLEKIFIDSDVSGLTELKHFSMLKNEKKSFQIALDITDSEFVNIDKEEIYAKAQEICNRLKN